MTPKKPSNMERLAELLVHGKITLPDAGKSAHVVLTLYNPDTDESVTMAHPATPAAVAFATRAAEDLANAILGSPQNKPGAAE